MGVQTLSGRTSERTHFPSGMLLVASDLENTSTSHLRIQSLLATLVDNIQAYSSYKFISTWCSQCHSQCISYRDDEAVEQR